MDIRHLLSKKKLMFLIVFILLSFIGERVNFSALVGAKNQSFTLFQFFGPIAGSFLGPIVGVLTVLIAELANFLVLGKSWTAINILRLLPMLFASYYFGTIKDKINFKKLSSRISVIIPALAIILFIVHPIGRTVWFFSLFWAIPIIVSLLPKKYSKNLFLRSLGATFMAHAVGGAIWIYSIKMTAQQWIALIPVVAYERLLFAAGIAVSYIVINTILDKLDTKVTAGVVNIEKKYALFSNPKRKNYIS